MGSVLKFSKIEPLKLQKNASEHTAMTNALFENLPKLLSPENVESLGIAAIATVYDWKYRPEKYGVPSLLFAPKRTKGSRLKINRDTLREWITSWEVK